MEMVLSGRFAARMLEDRSWSTRDQIRNQNPSQTRSSTKSRPSPRGMADQIGGAQTV